MFGELWMMMCFMQIDFFMFNLMSVMSNEVSFMQFRMQGFVVFYQSVGDIVMDCISLIRDIIIFNGDVQVQFFNYVDQFQWLMNYYVGSFMIEVLFQRMLVDYDFIVVWFDENVSCGIFVVISVVVLIFSYCL